MTERIVPGKNAAEKQGNGHRPNGHKPTLEELLQPGKIETAIMSRPNVTLHARRDEAGRRAFETLDKAGVHFRVKLDLSAEDDIYVAWGEKDPNPERLRHPEGDKGIIHKGQKGIEFFVDMRQKLHKIMDEASERRDPHISEQGHPAIGEWHQEMRQRQRAQNKDLMFPEETASQS